MELPPLLRQAVDRALSGTALADLAASAAALSQRYREERRDGRLYIASDRDALAYLAVRLPATYAAVRASFAAIAQARPDFAPKTVLDIGAGPGTACGPPPIVGPLSKTPCLSRRARFSAPAANASRRRRGSRISCRT